MLELRVRIPPVHVCLSVLSVVCCQVQVSVTGRSLVQRIPTKCGVSECDLETSTMRKPRPTRDCKAIIKGYNKARDVNVMRVKLSCLFLKR